MLPLYLVLGVLSGAAFGQTTNTSCITYNSRCTSSSSCCNSPVILCLPDIRNTSSCLSPLDVVNLSPQLVGTNVVAGFEAGLPPNSNGTFSELVQINGNTVYNQTGPLTPMITAPVNMSWWD